MSMDLLPSLLESISPRLACLLAARYFRCPLQSFKNIDLKNIIKTKLKPSTLPYKDAVRIFEKLGDDLAEAIHTVVIQRNIDISFHTVMPHLGPEFFRRISDTILLAKHLDHPSVSAALHHQDLTAPFIVLGEMPTFDYMLDLFGRLWCVMANSLPIFEDSAAEGSIQRLSNIREHLTQNLKSAIPRESMVQIGDRNSSCEAEYRHEVVRSQDYMELFGSDLHSVAREHSLSIAYVSLKLQQAPEDGEEDSRSVLVSAEVLLDTLNPEAGLWLIRGEAGSGKSTYFRWIAINAAKSLPTWRNAPNQSSTDFSTSHWQFRIPFLIKLRDLRPEESLGPKEFPQIVARRWKGVSPEWIKSILNQGRGMLLIDGVDETSKDLRVDLRTALMSLVKEYPGNYFLVSTRPKAVPIGWLSDSGFREATVNPMSTADISRFVDNWHKAIAEKLKEMGAPSKVDKLAARLKEQLAENSSISELATTPLLCAMICALHHRGEQILPRTQSDLCEALCKMLLSRELQSKIDPASLPKEYTDLDYPDRRKIIKSIAYNMVVSDLSVIEQDTALKLIHRTLERIPSVIVPNEKVVYDAIIERSGILREPMQDYVDFIHNTIKEYLAAERYVEEQLTDRLALDAMLPDKQEILRFAAATTVSEWFPNQLIRKILRPTSPPPQSLNRTRAVLPPIQPRPEPTAERIVVALRCAAVARDLDVELRAELNRLRAQLVPPNNLTDAQIIARGGDALIDGLAYDAHAPQYVVQACAEALRLMNTARSQSLLKAYLHDNRPQVVAVLARAFPVFTIPAIQDSLHATGRFPVDVAGYVCSLMGIENLRDRLKLEKLDLSGTVVEDLQPLTQVCNLRELTLTGLQIKDQNFTPLGQLSDLRVLGLQGTNILNLSPVGKIAKLTRLNLEGTAVARLDPLGELNWLDTLALSGSRIESLQPLGRLRRLRRLLLRSVEVHNWSELGTLTNLTDLSIVDGRIDKVDPIANLSRLQYLDLRGTKIADATPLMRLKNLQKLDLRGTGVTSFVPTHPIKTLSLDPVRIEKVKRQETKMSVDIALIVPIHDEWSIVEDHLESAWRAERTGNGIYDFIFELHGYKCVATCVHDMGETECALATQRVLNKWNPKNVVLIGIAGGMSDDVKIGDVVAGLQIESYFANAKATTSKSNYTFTLSGNKYRSSKPLLNEARNLASVHPRIREKWAQLCTSAELIVKDEQQRILASKLLTEITSSENQDMVRPVPSWKDGDIACGPAVAASSAFIRFLKEHNRRYLAVEMESAGLLAAVDSQAHNCNTLVLRGISDLADEGKAALEKKSKGALRSYAANNALLFFFAMMEAGVFPRAQ